MPARKPTEAKKLETAGKSKRFNFSFWNGILPKTVSILSLIFFLTWTLIGFFLIFQAVYSGILNRGAQSGQQQAVDTPQPPAEVNLTGIGRVNVKCVQGALSQESIQKIIQEKSEKNLSADEKAKFDKCITGPAATEEPSPAPSK